MLNPLRALLSGLTPTAILDILLVAVLIYQLLMVVRGTRAAQVLLGIVFLIGLYALASMVGLEAFRSLLSGIVPYTAIALVVLFQSEIRRTLARFGRRR